jgi:hypothetical protein
MLDQKFQIFQHSSENWGLAINAWEKNLKEFILVKNSKILKDGESKDVRRGSKFECAVLNNLRG